MISRPPLGPVARPVPASGRSALYGRHRSPKALLRTPAPASTDSARVCSFQLPEVCSFRLPLTDRLAVAGSGRLFGRFWVSRRESGEVGGRIILRRSPPKLVGGSTWNRWA